ncbi:MAG: hypothetical protein KC547_14460 [Anaerolineae bacterium]|nr:hypothetical protein [Anaerolineae bacterium]
MANKIFELNRADLEARYLLFNEFALNDQRRFYKRAVDRNRDASAQVNRIRAILALITGLASALAIFVVTVQPACATSAFGAAFAASSAEQAPTASAPGADGAVDVTADAESLASCGSWTGVLVVLLITSVVAPALGGAFSTLADLYQWDRLINVYESALENIEVADAKSPIKEMEDDYYQASLQAFALGTLSVMRDETAQWGQIIKTPDQLDAFIAASMGRAQSAAQALPTLDTLKSYTADEMRRLRERLDEAEALADAQRVPPPPPPPKSPPAGGTSDPADPEPDAGGG